MPESASDIAHGQTTITVVVKQPKVEHKVRMRDFEAWLESSGVRRQRGPLKGSFARLGKYHPTLRAAGCPAGTNPAANVLKFRT
jgi:hypothetical protein